MNNVTRLKRLKVLRHMLKNHDKIFKTVKFRMNTWNRALEEDRFNIKAIENGSCKTSACALGSAALYPPFKKLGLRFEPGEIAPCYKGHTWEEAGARFFGIKSYESAYLFTDNLRLTRVQVIKRVDSLIKKYKA